MNLDDLIQAVNERAVLSINPVDRELFEEVKQYLRKAREYEVLRKATTLETRSEFR